MGSDDIKNTLSNLTWHYGEAIGHIVGGGILFVVILIMVVAVGIATDWLMASNTVHPWIVSTIFGIKLVALVLDGLLLMAVGFKAIKAVLA